MRQPPAPGLVLLFLVAALALFGCADRGNRADDDNRGGFYGGVSGGLSR